MKLGYRNFFRGRCTRGSRFCQKSW